MDSALIEYLRELGATDDELSEAIATGSLGALALELALRGPGDPVAFEEAATRAGLEVTAAADFWRALGFPDPRHRRPVVAPRQIETLGLLARMTEALGTETVLALARVIGSSMAQVAEAIVDAFRVNVEMPRRDRGDPYPEVVRDYVQTASSVLPALTDALGDVLAGHLLSVSRSGWTLDEQRATVTRRLAVGFADLVEFTRMTGNLVPAELSGVIGRFESRVGEVVARYEGRVVKLIGDEVMFAVDDVGRAAELVCELVEDLSADPELPAVRVGLAAGPVVSRHGDYYGDVVNLAARLVKAAEPGAALISEAVVEQAPSPTKAEPVEALVLKGYGSGARAYKLSGGRRASGQ